MNHCSKIDYEELKKIGLQASHFDEFKVKMGSLSYAQFKWINNRYGKGPARQQGDEKSRIAEAFRNDLENSSRFAFHK